MVRVAPAFGKLVYHEREPEERPALQDRIEASVRTDEFRQEVVAMRRTIADVLKEEGKREGWKEGRKEGQVLARRDILLDQLRERFGRVPPEVVNTIETTDNIKRLNAWLKRLVKVKSLEDVRISPTP
jgi:flagellar biosynthesis/type III secretory pathway protein FliH